MAMADKYREVYRTMGGPPRLFGFGKNGARYAQMCDAINAMCEKMNNLCTPDQSGQRPEYTPGENEELKALQTRTVEACLEYIGGRKPEDILFRSEYVRYMSAKRIIELVDKDRRKMEDIDFSIHPTLRDVISRVRGSVEEVDLEQARRVSGAMSTRIYLPATDEREEGYFVPPQFVETEEEKHHKSIELVLRQFPQYAPYIKILSRPEKDFPYGVVQWSVGERLECGEKAWMENARDKDAARFRKYIQPYLDALKKVMSNEFTREMAGLPVEETLDDLMGKAEFRQMLFTLHNGADYAFNKFNVLKDTGIPVGRDLTRRNVAMSLVAQRLGRVDMLVRAWPTSLMDTASGQKTKGVFMEKARGLDLNNQNAEPLFSTPGIVWDTPEAKIQLASMQVIDWICGNTDRHKANMFYDLQKGEDGVVRLMGVQGIDNDNSFGVKSVKELEEGYGGESAGHILPTPETMGVIRKDDAMEVMSLERKDLNLLLFNLLEPDEIEAAWERVEHLQKAIMKGKGQRWKDSSEVKRGIVRILEDEEIGALPQSVYAYLPEMKRLVAIPKSLAEPKDDCGC